MRIGIFTNCYLPLVNGVVGAVSLLRKGFLEQGHEVHIFTPAFDDFRDDEPNIHRYPAVDLTRKVKYPVAIPFSPRIARLIRETEFDVFHAHHPFVLGPLALKTARRCRIPIVSTFHTQYDQYSHYVPLPAGIVSWYSKRKVRIFNQAVDRITTPAESAREVLHRYGVTRPIEVIPNPVDLTRFQQGNGALIRRQYGLTNEKVIINIGRIAAEKNLPLLLESFQKLISISDQTVKLFIVGDGPELGRIKNIAASMGLADQVIFPGMVTPAQVPDFLAAADLFVMTSTTEVKPLALLEALAAGVPVVAVAAAGANDTIIHGENGLLVALDANEISLAIQDLLIRSEKYRLFQTAARKTAQRYSCPVIAGEYLKLFGEVIGK